MHRSEVPPFLCLALDRIVVHCPQPYPHYVRRDVCLACLYPRGVFHLLSAAWETVLGFARDELHGRKLHEVLSASGTGEDAFRLVLSPSEADPLALDLRRKDGRLQRMYWYRRFDPYDTSLFIVAEPAGARPQKLRSPSPPGPV